VARPAAAVRSRPRRPRWLTAIGGACRRLGMSQWAECITRNLVRPWSELSKGSESDVYWGRVAAGLRQPRQAISGIAISAAVAAP